MKLFLSLALFAAFLLCPTGLARMVSARDFPLLPRRLYRLYFRFSLSADCLSAVIPRGCRRCWRSRLPAYTACRPRLRLLWCSDSSAGIRSVPRPRVRCSPRVCYPAKRQSA